MSETKPYYDELELANLRLDPENPRLPEYLHGASEDELLAYIAEAYNPMEIGRSIAEHGYFLSEPLIVVKEAPDAYRVVEGNRRLVALRLLENPELASDLDEAEEWSELSDKADLPDAIPVVVAPSVEAVAPIIGYRHISGIEPWDPFAKARYIAKLVDSGESLSGVAKIVGEDQGSVAAYYRNLQIVKQTKEEFEIDVSRAIARFGVFTRAMSAGNLRDFIGAPSPASVEPGSLPMPSESRDNVRLLLSWLFGDAGGPPVIGESRDLTRLSAVVGSAEGREVLTTTRDLEVAFEAAGGLRERLHRRLVRALGYLNAALEDSSAHRDDEEIQALVAECRAALDRLVMPDESTS